MVREATDNGRAIVEGLVEIASDPETSKRDRVSAYQVLLDRGFGKAVETSLQLQVDAGSSDALAQLADAELERLAATLAPSAVRPVVVLPAASLSPDAGLLPDPPPEALEAPLRPPEPVTQVNVPATTDPVAPLPEPVKSVAPPRKRRIVAPGPAVPRPPTARIDEPEVLGIVDRSDLDP